MAVFEEYQTKFLQGQCEVIIGYLISKELQIKMKFDSHITYTKEQDI